MSFCHRKRWAQHNQAKGPPNPSGHALHSLPRAVGNGSGMPVGLRVPQTGLVGGGKARGVWDVERPDHQPQAVSPMPPQQLLFSPNCSDILLAVQCLTALATSILFHLVCFL